MARAGTIVTASKRRLGLMLEIIRLNHERLLKDTSMYVA